MSDAGDFAAAAPVRSPVTRPGAVTAMIGVGDSVTLGSACACDNFMTLLSRSQAAAQGTPVHLRNDGRNGLTSGGLLARLRDADVAKAVASSEVIVVTIGANDFDSGVLDGPDCAPARKLKCYQPGLAALRSNLRRVLSRISHLQRGSRSRVLLTGYWNVFLDGAVGRDRGLRYVARSEALTRQVNRVIKRAAGDADADYVDLYAAFKPDADSDDTGLIAADGDHPNAVGHRVIAAALGKALAVPTLPLDGPKVPIVSSKCREA
ncbi:MAG: SGNH/GDSL hydrolase family protein [Actinomycetota bacterium]